MGGSDGGVFSRGGTCLLAAPLTKGVPSDHWKSPSMVRSFKPIHWYSLYWSGGAKGGEGGARPAPPQHPLSGGGSRALEAGFGEIWGLAESAGRWGVSPARGRCWEV